MVAEAPQRPRWLCAAPDRLCIGAARSPASGDAVRLKSGGLIKKCEGQTPFPWWQKTAGKNQGDFELEVSNKAKRRMVGVFPFFFFKGEEVMWASAQWRVTCPAFFPSWSPELCKQSYMHTPGKDQRTLLRNHWPAQEKYLKKLTAGDPVIEWLKQNIRCSSPPRTKKLTHLWVFQSASLLNMKRQ